MTGAASPSLPEDFLDRIDQQLGDTDTFLARCYRVTTTCYNAAISRAPVRRSTRSGWELLVSADAEVGG
jgi:hypothetical protein